MIDGTVTFLEDHPDRHQDPVAAGVSGGDLRRDHGAALAAQSRHDPRKARGRHSARARWGAPPA